ncbi:MAG: hypothetical protein V3T84_10025 [Phycisphaerales bacterium]
MATQTEMNELRMDLEQLREELVAGTLREQHAWAILDRTGALLDQFQGDPFERNLRIVYSLVSVGLEQLAAAKAAPRGDAGRVAPAALNPDPPVRLATTLRFTTAAAGGGLNRLGNPCPAVLIDP